MFQNSIGRAMHLFENKSSRSQNSSSIYAVAQMQPCQLWISRKNMIFSVSGMIPIFNRKLNMIRDLMRSKKYVRSNEYPISSENTMLGDFFRLSSDTKIRPNVEKNVLSATIWDSRDLLDLARSYDILTIPQPLIRHLIKILRKCSRLVINMAENMVLNFSRLPSEKIMAFNEVLTILINITSIDRITVDVYILTLFPFVFGMQKRK